MRPSRLPAATLLAFALAACAGDVTEPHIPPASVTATAQKTSVVEETFPIGFRLEGGRCGLTSGVTAEGEMHSVMHTIRTDDGRTLQVALHLSASGTAVADDGTRYRFNYHLNRRRIDYTGAPPFEVKWNDHFHLIGQGGAPDVHTFYRWHFLVGVGGGRTYLHDVTIGDPTNCDPI